MTVDFMSPEVVMQVPRLIAVEGPDGAGKTTFIKELSKTFSNFNIPYIVLQMMPEGPIRELALYDKSLNKYQVAALYRIAAETVRQQINEALASSKFVILDRTQLSWRIYQGELNDLKTQIAYVDRGFPNFPKEDILILISGEPEVLVERIKSRAAGDILDRFEEELIAKDDLFNEDAVDYGQERLTRMQTVVDLYLKEMFSISENTLETRKLITLDASIPQDINAVIAFEQIFEVKKG